MFASKDIFLTAPSGGYTIARSVRFRSSATAYFNRTPASATNRKTWTWSGWVKRGALGSTQHLFQSGYSTNPWFALQFETDNTIQVSFSAGTSSGSYTSAVFRDPSAWYHIVLKVDTTQATAANRVVLYVNGVQQTFGTTNYPSQNFDTQVNNTVLHTIGGFASLGGFYLDGYLTEVNFIDGQALTPSSFGETDSITGVWKPKAYSGTYGTNGFELNFSDNSNNTAATIGKDYSGNGNNWTPNNISVTAGVTYDSMTDVPTLTSATAANYAVWNPLYVIPSNTATSFTNGNLTFAPTGAEGVGEASAVTTMPLPTTGKWYWEVTPSVVATLGPSRTQIGIMAQAQISFVVGQNSNCFAYTAQGSSFSKVTANTFSSYGASYAANDVIGVAVDLDNGAIYFSKNNTFQNSGVPTSGASKTGAAFTTLTGSSNYFPAVGYWGTYNANFGQQPFVYTPPTGFLALNTYNL
jgi:hypothetical protein